MAVKIYREEIVKTEDGEQFEIETWGELHLMPHQAQSVFAIFGVFERTERRTLLYTASSEDADIHLLDSQYLDDLACLQANNIEIVDRRQWREQ